MESGGYPATSARHNTQDASEPNGSYAPRPGRGLSPPTANLAAWLLTRDAGFSLPEAMAVVTRHPALACGLHDRGELALGQRADLVRVRAVGDAPVVREVVVAGRRVV